MPPTKQNLWDRGVALGYGTLLLVLIVLTGMALSTAATASREAVAADTGLKAHVERQAVAEAWLRDSIQDLQSRLRDISQSLSDVKDRLPRKSEQP